MVNFSSSVFMSQFNNCIVRRSNSFSVPVSKFSREILALFYKEGYVFSYYYDATKNYFIVYPNHRVITFKLSLCSKASRKLYFKFFQIKKSVNSGKFFVLKTCFGLQFSDTARFNKIGGQPIFIINYFLWWFGLVIFLDQFLLIFSKSAMRMLLLMAWVIIFLFQSLLQPSLNSVISESD